MCNFIIRPIKCYPTVDIFVHLGEDTVTRLEVGDYVEVKEIGTDSSVLVTVHGKNFKDGDEVYIPMLTFTHAFSKNDPTEKPKQEKKESK